MGNIAAADEKETVPLDSATSIPADLMPMASSLTASPGEVAEASPGEVAEASPGEVAEASPGEVAEASPGEVAEASEVDRTQLRGREQ